MITAALRDRLERIARVRTLLVACDYDGTLAPLVANPAAAVPDAAALALLVQINGLKGAHGAVISGRSLETLRRLVGATTGMTLIGTHGAEVADLQVDAELAWKVACLTGDLRQLAAQFPGCEVEAKPVGAAFHYRNAAIGGSIAARRALRLGEAAGARPISGKKVVELVLLDVDKGMAISELKSRLDADAVVFIGDDTTDEDVFAVLGESDLGIKVGPEPTLAQARIAAQGDIRAVLRVIEGTRKESLA